MRDLLMDARTLYFGVQLWSPPKMTTRRVTDNLQPTLVKSRHEAEGWELHPLQESDLSKYLQ